jgi:hypothetical protein
MKRVLRMSILMLGLAGTFAAAVQVSALDGGVMPLCPPGSTAPKCALLPPQMK